MKFTYINKTKLTQNCLFALATSGTFLLAGCGTAEGDATGVNEPAEAAEITPVYEYIMGGRWDFDADNSEVSWSRILDQKATKKKVKLFGAEVDMELGPVKLNMEGDVSLKEGYLNDENGNYQDGVIIFDMATFKFAEEKGEGLFNTNDYPNSTLEFLSFDPISDGEYNYNSNVRLTIQDHSEEFEVPLKIETGESLVNVTGEFQFNTLDFPLRESARKKDVNKDEITVDMDMNFNLVKTMVKDSVRTN